MHLGKKMPILVYVDLLKQRRCIRLIVLFTFLITCSYIYLLHKTQTVTKCPSFNKMVSEEANMENECLIDYILKTKLIFPSKLQYNLTTRLDDTHIGIIGKDPIQSLIKDKDAPWLEALILVETFVPKRGQRIFLELGALDGIMFSSTLHLERFLNWTGLLIEVDNRFFTDLEHVHRKAYAINLCASLVSHPSIVYFQPSPVFISIENKGYKETIVNPAIGQIPNSGRIEEALFVQNQVKTDLIQVKCVPVYSMMLAVNITTIDLFILDVEGVEMDILETIPFEKVTINVLLIEVHGKKEELRTKMHSYLVYNGYVFYDTFSGRLHPGDDIFIKEDYYNSQDRLIMKNINVRELYKILTGTKEEYISESNLKMFSALTSLF